MPRVSSRVLSGRRATIFAAGAIVAIAAMGTDPQPARAVDFASVVPGSLSQGSAAGSASLGSGTQYANESNNLGDWPLDTGSFAGSVFAISINNANFNGNGFGGTPNSVIAFGNDGGATLSFAQPIHPVAGQKEFGLFTAQDLSSSGTFFNGNMQAALLVSADGVSWRTLDGTVVASPTTYVATSSKLNAPTVAYDYGTSQQAWNDGFGATSDQLAALTIADYQTPMPNDDLFNGAATDAQRAALQSDGSAADYGAIFGSTGGGNWFDISNSGLSSVQFVRLNAVNTDAAVRLDGAFANPAAVPEPGSVGALIGALVLLGCGRPRTRR
jgi:hypothetical protein